MSEMKEELKRLNSLSNFYESKEVNIDRDITAHYTLLLAKNYLNGNKLLLMGLGNGYVAEQLCNFFQDVTVIEGSEQLIQRIKKPNAKYKIIHSLFEGFTIEEKFDCL